LWIARATISLPVPLSPRISTGWVDFLHLGRCSDQVPHAILCAQPLSQSAAFDVEVHPLAGAFQDAGQLLQPKRLGQVVSRPDAHRFHRRRYGCKRGHHHDTGIRIESFDLTKQLQPTPTGKLQIEQKHVHRLLLIQDCQGLRHATRRERNKAHSSGDLAARFA
jgi:hypothetical protein